MRGLRGIATERVLSERVEYCGMGAHEYLNKVNRSRIIMSQTIGEHLEVYR